MEAKAALCFGSLLIPDKHQQVFYSTTTTIIIGDDVDGANGSKLIAFNRLVLPGKPPSELLLELTSSAYMTQKNARQLVHSPVYFSN